MNNSMIANKGYIKKALGAKLAYYLFGTCSVDSLSVVKEIIFILRLRGHSDTNIQSWFQGMNPALGGISPARFVVKWSGDIETLWVSIYSAIEEMD